MTAFQIFAFYVLPVALAVGGWLYARSYSHPKDARRHVH